MNPGISVFSLCGSFFWLLTEELLGSLNGNQNAQDQQQNSEDQLQRIAQSQTGGNQSAGQRV